MKGVGSISKPIRFCVREILSMLRQRGGLLLLDDTSTFAASPVSAAELPRELSREVGGAGSTGFSASTAAAAKSRAIPARRRFIGFVRTIVIVSPKL